MRSGSPPKTKPPPRLPPMRDRTEGTKGRAGRIPIRAFTHELYRRFGAIHRVGASPTTSRAIIDSSPSDLVSMIQQRKRVYDLAYDLGRKVCVEHCPQDKPRTTNLGAHHHGPSGAVQSQPEVLPTTSLRGRGDRRPRLGAASRSLPPPEEELDMNFSTSPATSGWSEIDNQ